MNGATTLFKSSHQNDWLLRNYGRLKISLLQSYEVLWIHNIDAICCKENVFTKFDIALSTSQLKHFHTMVSKSRSKHSFFT